MFESCRPDHFRELAAPSAYIQSRTQSLGRPGLFLFATRRIPARRRRQFPEGLSADRLSRWRAMIARIMP